MDVDVAGINELDERDECGGVGGVKNGNDRGFVIVCFVDIDVAFFKPLFLLWEQTFV